MLVAKYVALTVLAATCHTVTAEDFHVVVATQNHFVFGETFLAEVAQRHLTHVTFEAIHVPEFVQTLK